MIGRSADFDRSDSTPSPATPRRASTLLERVLSSEGITAEHVATGLMVSTATLSAYVARSQLIPLDVQLLLVAFTIERVPQHARLARQLREQIKATITYAARETVTHSEPPPISRW